MHTYHPLEVSDRFTDVLREYTHEQQLLLVLLAAILAAELAMAPEQFWDGVNDGTLLEDASRDLMTIVEDVGDEYSRRLAEHLYELADAMRK